MTRVFVNRTGSYYRTRKRPEDRMDDELTLSHVLRAGNKFTESGLPYGKTIAKRLLGMKAVKGSPRILEVGPGLGDLAGSFCSVIPPKEYVFLDISEDLIENLRDRFVGEEFRFIVGDFLDIGIREKFDLVICNEVLADFPTIVNMSKENARIEEKDREIYKDALRMAEEYHLAAKGNLNYGAVKFLEKVKGMLNEKGAVFICEQGSKTPERIRVEDHVEYTIDFEMLGKVAKKLGFRTKTGRMTEFLGAKNRKAVLFYMQPELKSIYDFFKRQGIFLDQKAYEIPELMNMLERMNVSVSMEYREFLKRQAKPFRKVTDQFRYIILGS